MNVLFSIVLLKINLLTYLLQRLPKKSVAAPLPADTVSCGCPGNCKTKVCRCQKAGRRCGEACRCTDSNCVNRTVEEPVSTTSDDHALVCVMAECDFSSSSIICIHVYGILKACPSSSMSVAFFTCVRLSLTRFADMSIYDHLSFHLDKGAYHPGTGAAHRKRNVRYAAKKYFTKGSFLTIFGERYRLPMAMNIYIQTCAPHEKTFSILRKKFRNSAQNNFPY